MRSWMLVDDSSKHAECIPQEALLCLQPKTQESKSSAVYSERLGLPGHIIVQHCKKGFDIGNFTDRNVHCRMLALLF